LQRVAAAARFLLDHQQRFLEELIAHDLVPALAGGDELVVALEAVLTLQSLMQVLMTFYDAFEPIRVALFEVLQLKVLLLHFGQSHEAVGLSLVLLGLSGRTDLPY
jgi:hypothetical protein